MRIGFFNGYSIWGGGEKWHFEMANYCKSLGDEVVMYSPVDGELAKRSLEVGLVIRDIAISKHSYFNPMFLIKLTRLVKKDNLDVLVFNSFRDVRAAAYAIKKAGVKKVVLRCGMPIAPKQSLSYLFNFRVGLDYFVPISESIRDEFLEKSPKLLRENQCVPYIANGIDLKDFTYVGETTKDGQTIVLGNASRLSHQKGLDLLLPSLKILKDKGIPFIMKIAGEGEERDFLIKLAHELGLQDNVEFIGHIDNVSDFVKEIDIYVFTSRYEGTARSMIEAMACGKPVVAFNTSSMREVVSDDETGLLVKPFSIEDFAAKTEVLIKDKNLRQQFGKEGRARVENLFNKEKNFATWYEFLNSK